MQMQVTSQAVLKVAAKYVGAKQYSNVHKGLIDRYNRVLPRPSGYHMTYEDAWCDAFVTAVADEAGASGLIGRECGVERHIKLCRGLGIWLGRVRPALGDLVMFDWDGGGFADHIGYVSEVSGDRFRTIEGNSKDRVEQNWFIWNDWRVKGFARPKYLNQPSAVVGGITKGETGETDSVGKKTLDTLALEVLLGTWGNHPERARALTAAGYDAGAVQKQVNQRLTDDQVTKEAKFKQVQVLPLAQRFFTGELMDAWMKGSRFEVLDQKTVAKQLVYLLGYKGGVIGWLRASDVKNV